MAKSDTSVTPKTFFLNELHESREDKSGGGRTPRYFGIDWRAKGRGISHSLRAVSDKLKKSKDPLRERRRYLVAKPVPRLTKLSEAKKHSATGNVIEETQFSGAHGRVFGRLGLDLIEVTGQGEAIVHAVPQRCEQLIARAESLESLGIREQVRWATVDSFDVIPPSLRVDGEWLDRLAPREIVDVIIELQPLLTRLEIEEVLRAIAKYFPANSGERLIGTGTDFSGRQWLRGRLAPRSVRAIADDFFSVQSLHEPFYSLAAGKKIANSSVRIRATAETHRVPYNVSSLPCVGLFDSGVPEGHLFLEPYRRGRFIAPDAPGRPGDHGSRVASRIVFGEQDFYAGLTGVESITGGCRFLDVQCSLGFSKFDDKTILQAMQGVSAAYPDVRTYNCSFAAGPLPVSPSIERRERLLMTQDLDNFIFANDVVAVMAAGNVEPGVVPSPRYPRHVDHPDWQLGHWASGFNSLVCGSHVGHLSPNGLVKQLGWPSPFTRIGPGVCLAPVPGFSAPGGNGNEQHSAAAGVGVWVCNGVGRWEDVSGTSHAAPLLSREVARAFDFLQRFCPTDARPFGVTVKAFLALTAQRPWTGDADDDVLALCERTLGRGVASCQRLIEPSNFSAVMLWQGTLENAAALCRVQIPIPKSWLDEAIKPRLRLIISADVPVNGAIPDRWACRKVSAKLRPHPDADALRPIRGESHQSFPMTERKYDLSRVGRVKIADDFWFVEIEYAEIADYHPAIDFTPQQRVAFAAELFDEDERPHSPQQAIQSIPATANMNRLGLPSVTIRNPVILKINVG